MTLQYFINQRPDGAGYYYGHYGTPGHGEMTIKVRLPNDIGDRFAAYVDGSLVGVADTYRDALTMAVDHCERQEEAREDD